MAGTINKTALSTPLRTYIALVATGGAALGFYLATGVEWGPATVGQVGLFILLIIGAGVFPLRVGPRVKTDVTTTPLFAAAIVLEPGAAVVAGVAGLVASTMLVRFWGERIRLPWYKYPFNAGQAAFFMGLTSVVFHGLNSSESLLSPAVLPAAVCYYLVNTSLVSCAAGLQLSVSPLRFWVMGTRENGIAELSMLAFGCLGGMLYDESPWTVVAMLIPVGVLYHNFARMANKITERELAEEALQKSKEELEIRVQLRTLELSNTNEQLSLSRRRIVQSQEQLRKAVAAQLHGPVQNRLLVATHWLRTAQETMSASDTKSAEHLANAASLIEEINQGDLRAAMGRLHPSLIRVSLQASLRSLGDQFANSFKVELHQSGDGDDEIWRSGRLPEELRLATYRVAEEALNNVLKHARATVVDIWLENPTDDSIRLTILDDGRGFDLDTTTPGFGVLSMQDYIGAVGGKLDIKTHLGKGTTVVATFPLSPSVSDPVQFPNGSIALTEDASMWVAVQPNGNGHSNGHANGHSNGLSNGHSNGHANGHSEELEALKDVDARGEAAPTRLVVVDDQPDFCMLIRELLSPYDELNVAGEAHDGLDCLRLVEELQPDAVLLDMEMPGLHGLETAQELHRRFPDVKVVLMSAYHQSEYLDASMPVGALDFIPKSGFSVDRLRQACQLVKVAVPSTAVIAGSPN